MKNNQYFLNTALAIVLGIAAIVAVLVRTFVPAAVIPGLDIPNIAAISLIALVLDHYVTGGAKRCYICIPVFSAITFGLIPFCAGFASTLEAAKLAILGGVIFTATTWIFTSMEDRLSTGPAAKLAPILSAAGLFLAAQCFAGLI
jgi:hypothetical protein